MEGRTPGSPGRLWFRYCNLPGGAKHDNFTGPKGLLGVYRDGKREYAAAALDDHELMNLEVEGL